MTFEEEARSLRKEARIRAHFRYMMNRAKVKKKKHLIYSWYLKGYMDPMTDTYYFRHNPGSSAWVHVTRDQNGWYSAQ